MLLARLVDVDISGDAGPSCARCWRKLRLDDLLASAGVSSGISLRDLSGCLGILADSHLLAQRLQYEMPLEHQLVRHRETIDINSLITVQQNI